MELRRIIPTDITASAVAHVSLLTLVLLFSDVHPFGAVTAEQIPVEIVTPQELAEKQAPPDEPPAENKPEPALSPQPDFSLLDKPAAATAPPPAAPAARPQKQAALAARLFQRLFQAEAAGERRRRRHFAVRARASARFPHLSAEPVA